jgi:AraC-like DNA-binding protein
VLDSAVLRFTDPHEHQRAVRAAEAELFVTGPGMYWAELIRVDLHRLWIQRSHSVLPHIAHHALKKDRTIIFFLADPHQAPIHHTGVEFTPGEIIFEAVGSEHYHRVSGESHWAAMSLSHEDLASTARAITGHDLVAPNENRVKRPPIELMARLRRLHYAAAQLAAAAPEILTHPEVARAIEQSLVSAMMSCLVEGMDIKRNSARHSRMPVMRRFEQLLEANPENILYLPDICAALGVPARTLRYHCMEHLGISPRQYLWLRRMNMARRSLGRSDPQSTTVTAIANDHGFAELGRFAVGYRNLFGEPPSATLRRPPYHAQNAAAEFSFGFLPKLHSHPGP